MSTWVTAEEIGLTPSELLAAKDNRKYVFQVSVITDQGEDHARNLIAGVVHGHNEAERIAHGRRASMGVES